MESIQRVPGILLGTIRVVRQKSPDQVKFWFIALAVGIVAGFVAIGFRMGISSLQTLVYGTDDVMLASVARTLPWFWVVFLPIAGGLVVGIIMHIFTSDGRVRVVSDVIEGAALRDGRVEITVERDGEVVARHRPRGGKRPKLERVSLDLGAARGATVRVRVSDRDPRGRVAIDDLRLVD